MNQTISLHDRALAARRNMEQGYEPNAWYGRHTYGLRRQREMRWVMTGTGQWRTVNRNAYRVTY